MKWDLMFLIGMLAGAIYTGLETVESLELVAYEVEEHHSEVYPDEL